MFIVRESLSNFRMEVAARCCNLHPKLGVRIHFYKHCIPNGTKKSHFYPFTNLGWDCAHKIFRTLTSPAPQLFPPHPSFR